MSITENDVIKQTVLAASLCNARYGACAWDSADTSARYDWLALAAKVINELREHEWTLAAIG